MGWMPRVAGWVEQPAALTVSIGGGLQQSIPFFNSLYTKAFPTKVRWNGKYPLTNLEQYTRTIPGILNQNGQMTLKVKVIDPVFDTSWENLKMKI